MAFEWDPAERAAFDTALMAHLIAQFPEATFGWSELGRRLLVAFPEGAVCSVWEPNFFFSFPSFDRQYLFDQAAAAITAQRAQLASKLDT